MPSPLNITNIPAPRTPVIDPATGLLAREWYRFFLNLFVLTGQGNNPVSLEELQYGPPNNDQFVLNIQNTTDTTPNANDLISQIAELAKQVQAAELNAEATAQDFQSAVAELSKAVQASGMSAEAAISALQSQIVSLNNEVQALAVAPPTTPNLKRRAYGSFYDLTDQTAALANTAYAMAFGNTDYSNGVTIGSPTSRVYVDRPGFYNIQFSAQLDKTSANAGNVWIWLDKNGSTVSNSATQVTLQGSSAALVAAWNFLLQLNAGDYFRLMWSTDDIDCFIKHDTAVAPVPDIPSIILTVTDNINAYQD